MKKWLVAFKSLNIRTKYGELDLIYRPDGTEGFRDLSKRTVTEDIGGIEITVAALEDVIRSKQAAGRPRDLEQLQTLRNLFVSSRRQPRSKVEERAPDISPMPSTAVSIHV